MRMNAVLHLVPVTLLLTGASVAATAAEPDGTGVPLSADETAALAQALNYDPANPTADAPVKLRHRRRLSAPSHFSVSGHDKPDGSGSVAIKQSLSSRWDTKLGVDLNVAAPPPTSYQPDKPLPGSRTGTGKAAAWASVGIPNLASVDARVDPGNNQGSVGTTLQHSIGLGRDFSLTLRDRLAVSDALSTADSAPVSPPGLPVRALPQTSNSAASNPVWNNAPGVKLAIKPTGTTLAASFTSASNDPTTHNALSAEQKLYGPLHITTTVSDLGEPSVNKSITAGLKFDW